MQTFAIPAPDQTQTHTLLNATLAMGLVLMTVFALMAGKSVLVPFAMAVLLWFIINAFARRLARLAGNDGEPGLGAVAAAILIVIAICVGVAEVVASNAAAMVERAPTYLANIDVLTGKLSGLIGLKAFAELTAAIDAFDFDAVLLSLANGAAGVAGGIGTVVLYIAFLLAEQQFIGKKIRAMAANDDRHAKISAVFAEIGQRVRTYLFTKSLTSAAMAGMVWIALEIAGVDFAGFWAFLVFILNFIPVVGGIVSGIFPAALALVQFPTLTPFLIVVAGVGTAHLVIGNIVEPRFVGSSVNLSPLVVILALSIWGFIWGVAGMFLCVPITVIGMIIFSEFRSTRPIAIALSENGEIT
ncbi:AI-2E family transporter [Ruegeria sp. R14_0]|uniref:AI-2E family transporter n=1 Tax=Ruegeria sp. R14_0 TaxID=2821100 RepID=UPI001ADACA10|nr:AI-2E family transporter [Ruegeria sp. R14_0]MBO9448209.1 AI-2E family transporter [Ruegeria sp. R14_0]